MEYPEFYKEIEHIILKDKLSMFLGSTGGGIIDISYLDIVKMAGHSCVLVSGTYLMALKGLQKLYGTQLPVRGEIKVELRDQLSDGNTGATSDTGFKGINGKYNRRGLLFYGAHIVSNVRFTRLDTQASVEVNYVPGRVVSPGNNMESVLGPETTEEDRKIFHAQWQEMIRTIFQNTDKVIDLN